MTGLKCEANSDEERCCLYPLEVDFGEWEWDWIINPRRYAANYCAGLCPFVFQPEYPHTHLVQQSNINPSSGGPCCNPSKMSSISLLYYNDEENIVYGTLPKMVADVCSCS